MLVFKWLEKMLLSWLSLQFQIHNKEEMIDISILCLLLLQKEDKLNFCFYTYRHSLIICIFMYETQTYVT